MTDGAVLLPRSFFERDSHVVGPELLGSLLIAGDCVGRVVEVEAYGGSDDAASHAFRGQTPRNASMFGRPGLLYVYFTYGMHFCANVVTGKEGHGQAVLLRAVEPIAGIEQMRLRRTKPGRPTPPDTSLADGPGKLCQAFGIDRTHDGVDLCGRSAQRQVTLARDRTEPPDPLKVSATTRIGISKAQDLLWRWVLTRE